MSTEKFTPDMIWQRRLNSSIIQKCLDLQRVLGWTDAETFGIMACYLSDALESTMGQLEKALVNQISDPIEIVRDGKIERHVFLGNSAREMYDALTAIRQYGADTLSGRADGPDDRQWQRESVLEMTRRARVAIAKAEGRA